MSCRVSLQIDRVGTALQLPVPPYLEPDALSWGSMAAGGLWDTGMSWGWCQPGGHSGLLCHCGVQGAGLSSSTEQAAGLAGMASMEIIPWG